MIEHYVGANRRAPFPPPVQQNAAAEDTLQNNDLQVDTAAPSDLQEQTLERPEYYTISVEQVREHFRAKGLHKSKDTVQRWCRSGDLACQQRGVLNRYFTTEASLKKLERKLLPDMMADALGEAKPVVQTDVGAPADVISGTPLHADEDAAARSVTQPDAPASLPLHAAAVSQSMEVPTSSETNGEIENLREQLRSKDSEIEFLREEIRAARSERGNVVQISHRMMEAMETMVLGGKVDRLNSVDPTTGQPRRTTRDRV